MFRNTWYAWFVVSAIRRWYPSRKGRMCNDSAGCRWIFRATVQDTVDAILSIKKNKERLTKFWRGKPMALWVERATNHIMDSRVDKVFDTRTHTHTHTHTHKASYLGKSDVNVISLRLVFVFKSFHKKYVQNWKNKSWLQFLKVYIVILCS